MSQWYVQRQLLLVVFVMAAMIAMAGNTFAAKIEPLIIGGEEVSISRHPYLVSIRYRVAERSAYLHKCGGAIYTERVVITSAQCIDEIESNHVLVVAGATTRSGVDGYAYPASKWYVHEQYNPDTVDYDIGILIVDTPFDFKRYDMHSIHLATRQPAVGALAVVAGWGYREEFGPSSYRLEDVEVPIVATSDCLDIYGVTELTERMICAGYKAGGKDACQGDTGGPLVYKNQLVGLVSWGSGCARPGYPTVYTYVPILKQWIEDIVKANG